MKTIKRIAIAITGLLLLQILGLQLIGKRTLMTHVCKNMETMVLEQNELNKRAYYSTLGFSEKQKEHFERFHPDPHASSTFHLIPDSNRINPIQDVYYYCVVDSITMIGIANLYESESVESENDGFFCDWKSKYVWVLFGWLKLEKEMKSIT